MYDMTSKTIEIDEETYNKLLKKKKNNETISEVIDQLLGHKKKEKSNLRAFFGRWKDLPTDYFGIMEDAHKELRNDVNKRFQ